MAFTNDDKIYIHTTVSNAVLESERRLSVHFEKAMEQNRSHMTALKEGFQDEVKKVAELVIDRPTANDVERLIGEALYPIEQRLIRVEAKI